MIIVPCDQRSAEWNQARCGIPTASAFDRILTPTGERSKQAIAYRNELLAEWVVGHPEIGFNSDWMERGAVLEQQARDYYEVLTDHTIAQVGFVYKDERKLCGCSPDGLFRNPLYPARATREFDRGLEIKVLKPGNHIEHMLGEAALPLKYKPQVQGGMYVTDASEWEWLSYHPEMPPVLVTVPRDEKYIAKLHDAIESFLEDLLRQRELLTLRGIGTKAQLEASLVLLASK